MWRFIDALAQQQACRGELQHVDRAGRHFWVEVEVVPLVDASGRSTHLVAVQRDIGERRRADAAVRAAQDELAATLQAVPDLLFDIDIDGLIHGHHSPRSDLLVMPADEQVGRTVADVMPAAAAAQVMRGLHEAQALGASLGLHYELPLPQGPRWFEISVACKRVAAGEKARFILLARDITERMQGESERRALEGQLREAQKIESIGTLAGGIAHDFNNILAAILGNAALARAELATGHPALAGLEQITTAGVRARSLVQQILTFSRRQPQALAVQPLQPVLQETLTLLRATLPAAVRLDTVLAAEPLLVEADATQLQQVLMNLCTNAWHALPEDRGRIELGLQPGAAAPGRTVGELPPGPCAHLWVRDDGVGMDEATRARIFDPFFTTKPVGRGTGLGLSVVHGIVRGHRGSIAVESAPGQGTTVHVYLPLAAAPAAGVAEAGAATAAAEGGGRGESVLYVDDDEVMALMVERLLQREGWRVTVCSGAPQALALVLAQPAAFDVVVSDYNMPEMSGTAFAARLAQHVPGLPVIISSGYLSEALRRDAASVGVRALLQKEHTLERLSGLVRQVLAPASLESRDAS
jgi:signal transduction histidine kinase/CheY-like chemotaxis protein